ncbi:MAG: ATP synthase F0 subunit B [Deltaproteobacteria bacterium]|nr:ATP synthase F0 subunit B [Deltaproteobacteria bacterium]
MNPINRHLRMIFIMILMMAASIFLSYSDAFAVEQISEGRKLWNNIMLWVNFGILVFLFIKFAKNPLMDFLHSEQNKISETLSSVEEKVKSARVLMDAEADKLKDIDQSLQQIKDDIIELGRIEKDKIVESAKQTADQMIEDAKKQSEYRLESAKKRFSMEMLNEAISIAVEKLRNNITQEDNEKIIDRFTSKLTTSKARFM